MRSLDDFSLEPDLRTGVVPVSQASSALAALIRQAQAAHRPVVITQKGRPTGVLMDSALFSYLRDLIAAHAAQQGPSADAPERG